MRSLPTPCAITAFINTPEGVELAELFPKIGREQVRRQVPDLARTMAEQETQP